MSTTTKTRSTSAAASIDAQHVDLAEAVATARLEVEHQRAVLAGWETKARHTATELEQLQVRTGTDLLDDPAAEERITADTVRLQTGAELAEKAIAAQRPRVTAAESVYLFAEAAALEPAAAAVQAQLDEHEAETRRLLGLLEAHEGEFLAMADHVRATRQTGGPLRSWKAPKSSPLRAAAVLAQRQVEVVRAFAVGQDPAQLCVGWQVSPAEVYPPCMAGPAALVPTTGYLAGVQNQRDRVAEIEAALEQLPREIAEFEDGMHGMYDGEVRWRENAIASRRQRLAELGEELEGARANLATMTGATAPAE